MGVCSIDNNIHKTDITNKTDKIDKIKKFRFERNNHFEIEILMDSNKTIIELIIAYFKNINRIELIEDNRIDFSYNGKDISPEQTDLIKEYFKVNKDYYLIEVFDYDNLISYPKKIFKINFIPTNQENKAEIIIESDKTLKELILEYFKKINRLDLFGDKEIFFLFSGSSISINQKDFVDKYFKEDQENQILIVDNEDKITKKKIEYDEHDKQMPDNWISIIFMSSQIKIKVSIDNRRKIRELIKKFFAKIKRPELFGDKSINFYYKGDVIPPNSNDLIKIYFITDWEPIVTVDDMDKKIAISRLEYDSS